MQTWNMDVAAPTAARVVVLGDLSMDWVLRVPALPAPGAVVPAQALQSVPGGQGLRLALACARQGLQVHAFGSVGRDSAGHALRMALQQAGVATDQVQVHDGMDTGATLQLCEGAQAPRTVQLPGANACAQLPMQAFVAALSGAQYLLVGSALKAEVVQRAVHMGHAAGCAVALHASAESTLDVPSRAQLQLLVLDRVQACNYTGLAVHDADSALHAARVLLQQGVAQVVVRWGPAGAVALDGSGYSIHAIGHSAAALHPTSADALVGALLARLVEGADLSASVAWGLAAARLTPPWGAMPLRAEVQAAWDARGGAQ